MTSQQRQIFKDQTSQIEEESKAVAKVTTLIIFLAAMSLGVIITLLTKEPINITKVIIAVLIVGYITLMNYYFNTYPKTKLEIEIQYLKQIKGEGIKVGG